MRWLVTTSDLDGVADDHEAVRVLRRLGVVIVDTDDPSTLRSDPRVTRVEADQPGRLAQTVQTDAPWHLDRIDQRTLPLNDEYHYHHDGSGVRIYVLDTGVRGTHEEFTGRFVAGMNTFGSSAGTDDGSGTHGHGTSVAAAAVGTTGGVAKGATVVDVKCVNPALPLTSDVVAGIEWILQNHPGGPAVANLSTVFSASSTLDDAARDLIADGILLTAAAGNDDEDVSDNSPQRVSSVLVVGGTQDDDARYAASNHGPVVAVHAPAVDVTLASKSGNSAYAVRSGTSFSAPMAAGICALVLEQNPSLTPAQVRTLILSNATHDEITGLPENTPNRLAYSLITDVALQYLLTEAGDRLVTEDGNAILVEGFDDIDTADRVHATITLTGHVADAKLGYTADAVHTTITVTGHVGDVDAGGIIADRVHGTITVTGHVGEVLMPLVADRVHGSIRLTGHVRNVRSRPPIADPPAGVNRRVVTRSSVTLVEVD